MRLVAFFLIGGCLFIDRSKTQRVHRGEYEYTGEKLFVNKAGSDQMDQGAVGLGQKAQCGIGHACRDIQSRGARDEIYANSR